MFSIKNAMWIIVTIDLDYKNVFLPNFTRIRSCICSIEASSYQFDGQEWTETEHHLRPISSMNDRPPAWCDHSKSALECQCIAAQ